MVFLAIKVNKVLIRVTLGMNPENIFLSERAQSQRTTQYMIPLVRNLRKGNYIGIERKLVTVKAGRVVSGGRQGMGSDFSVMKML